MSGARFVVVGDDFLQHGKDGVIRLGGNVCGDGFQVKRNTTVEEFKGRF